MIHSGLEALEGHWDKEEYAAGYRARFSAIRDSEEAHHCWRTGWEDADTELLQSARHNRIFAEADVAKDVGHANQRDDYRAGIRAADWRSSIRRHRELDITFRGGSVTRTGTSAARTAVALWERMRSARLLAGLRL
jgi:hypothetical protein